MVHRYSFGVMRDAEEEERLRVNNTEIFIFDFLNLEKGYSEILFHSFIYLYFGFLMYYFEYSGHAQYITM